MQALLDEVMASTEDLFEMANAARFIKDTKEKKKAIDNFLNGEQYQLIIG